MQFAPLWIIGSAVFGAIVGSFLNVVIFRLPRGLSISKPRWSFCPHCEKQIAFSDNVPVLSWLLLRGKCRNCSTPIGVVYPLVECITAFLFMMIFDALFVGRSLPFIGTLATDWPMLVAYFSLFASLLAISGMDLEAYMIDVRVAVFAMVVGVICMAAWFGMNGAVASAVISGTAASSGAAHSGGWGLISGTAAGGKLPTGFLPDSMCLVAIAAGAVWAVWTLVWSRVAGGERAQEEAIEHEPGYEDQIPEAAAYLKTQKQLFRPWPVLIFVGLIAATALWRSAAPGEGLPVLGSAATQSGIFSCFVFMVLLVSASIVPRESDEQIVEEIESERSTARRVALRELVSLLPGLVAGLLLFIYWRSNDRLDDQLNSLVGGWLPGGTAGKVIEGAVQSLAAMIWAAAIGWGVRIGGTIAFGKEAYGTGDIYIMAAIGAVMGVWGLVFCFFLAALLALVGVLTMLFWKSSRAVPFGPWLAMGAFAALWLFTPLIGMFGPAGGMVWALVTGQPWMGGN